MKIRFLILLGIIVAIATVWFFDPFHKPVETIDELIGQNYDYACKIYFSKDPNHSTRFNINNNVSEFQGGILNKRSQLKDTMILQYTWTFINYKSTIWVAKTFRQDNEIIDAIRYKNGVQF